MSRPASRGAFTTCAAKGNAAKLHLALDGLPTIAGLAKKGLCRAHRDRAGRTLRRARIQSGQVRRDFAEAGRRTDVSEFPRRVARADRQARDVGGRAVRAVRAEGRLGQRRRKRTFTETVFKTIAQYAPDIEQRITASELLTPADIEREFHITGGHWHHGELTLDQFLFVRPVSGAAQYRMPLDGLYLCGAGTHPGGGVSGAAGRNAARAILRREKAA